MSSQVMPAPVAVPVRVARWSVRARILLAIFWAAMLLLTLAVGERHASYAQLRKDVAAGRVHDVRVTGGLPPRATGYSVTEVHWRPGLVGRDTEVLQARPRSAAPQDGRAVLGSDVGAQLAALQPGLRVTHASLSSSGSFWGWRLPTPLALAFMVGWLATLWVVVNGPQPWRATRWAWFWLLTSPLGVLAFLVLSGPTRRLPDPRVPARRLTGGLALVLAVVLRSLHVWGT